MKRERLVSSRYETAVKEMIDGSVCAGCPVLKKQFGTAALRLDHSINWANTSYAINLPKKALESVLGLTSLSDLRPAERREIFEDFERFFGRSAEDVVKQAKPAITPENIDSVAHDLVSGVPVRSKKLGDELVTELGERLAVCPNSKSNPKACALDS